MASAAANQTVTSTATTIFDQDTDGGKCARFFVGCRTGSASAILVNIRALHREDEFIGIPPGSALEFVQNPAGIAKVTAKGEGGNATVDWGVLEKTGSLQ